MGKHTYIKEYVKNLWKRGTITKTLMLCTVSVTITGLFLYGILNFSALLWFILICLAKDFREDYPNKSLILLISLSMIFIGGFIYTLHFAGFWLMFFVIVPEHWWNWLYNKVKKNK